MSKSADGTTQGEIMIRGNFGDEGLFRHPARHYEAFAGVFPFGDLAGLQTPQWPMQMRTRQGHIFSGGENISSIEVEGVLMGHPM